MATEQVLAAGRELDALIAERVLELAVREASPSSPVYVGDSYIERGHWLDTGHDRLVGDRGIRRVRPLPHYSTDIGAAWKIVEHLSADANFGIGRYADATWVARFGIGAGAPHASAATAPLVICLAALKKAGVDVP